MLHGLSAFGSQMPALNTLDFLLRLFHPAYPSSSSDRAGSTDRRVVGIIHIAGHAGRGVSWWRWDHYAMCRGASEACMARAAISLVFVWMLLASSRTFAAGPFGVIHVTLWQGGAFTDDKT